MIKLTDNTTLQNIVSRRVELIQQREIINAEIKRLADMIDIGNEAHFAPIKVARQDRERAAIEEANRTGKSVKYIDDDGCEVECTPSGHSFYNAADWY